MDDWGRKAEPKFHLDPSVLDETLDCGDKVDGAVDAELQAAIEYKVASDGLDGASVVLELLTLSVHRHLRGRRFA